MQVVHDAGMFPKAEIKLLLKKCKTFLALYHMFWQYVLISGSLLRIFIVKNNKNLGVIHGLMVYRLSCFTRISENSFLTIAGQPSIM